MALVLDDVVSLQSLVDLELLPSVLPVFVGHPNGGDLFENVNVACFPVAHFEDCAEGAFPDLADFFKATKPILRHSMDF